MESPLAGAGAGTSAAAASPTGRRPRGSWAALDRTPVFVGPEDLPAGMDYAVHLKSPPKLSNLFISRRAALLPGEDDLDYGLVQCVDGEGNLLLMSAWSAKAQDQAEAPGGEHGHALVVCRAGSGTGGGSGTVELVPPVGDEIGVLHTPPHACIGIVSVAYPHGGNYILTQVQSSAPTPSSAWPSSSSSSASAPREQHFALSYFSSTGQWIKTGVAADRPRVLEAHSDEEAGGCYLVEDMSGEQQREKFEAHTVISLPRQRPGSQAELVLVDLLHGLLLLLDPTAPAAARMLAFPGPEDGGLEAAEATEDVRDAATRRCVAWSGGCLCVVEVSVSSGSVSVFCLGEQEQWVRRFSVSFDDIWWSDASIARRVAWGRRQPAPSLGPLDPTRPDSLCLCSEDASVFFMVTVGTQEGTSRVCMSDKVEAAEMATGFSYSALHVETWRLSDDAPAAVAHWTTRAAALVGKGNGLRRIAWKAIKTGSKHLEKVVPIAQTIAYTQCPYAAPVAEVVTKMATANIAVGYSAQFVRWIAQPSSPPLETRVIASQDEAREVIEEWVSQDKPNNMLALPVPGLSGEELKSLHNLFVRHEARELLPLLPLCEEEEYFMVDRTASSFSST